MSAVVPEPIEPAALDPLRQAAIVADVYRRAEATLVERTARYIEQGLQTPTWRVDALRRAQALNAEATAVLAKANAEAAALARQLTADLYAQGNRQVLANLGPALSAFDAASLNRRASVQAIASEVSGLMDAASSQLLRRTDDVYRQVVARAVEATTARALPLREAAQEAMDDLLAKGYEGFTDAAGRNWRIGDYVEMAARTGLAKAEIRGHEDTIKAAGLDLVVVQPGPRACEICDMWARAILSLSGQSGVLIVENLATGEPMEVDVEATLEDARTDGFQHPNCRCAIAAYVPGVTDRSAIERPPWDQQGYEAQQQQRALERQVRAAKLDQARALSPEARAQAAARVERAQAALAQHLEANPALKPQPARTGLGGLRGTADERQAWANARAALRTDGLEGRALPTQSQIADNLEANLSRYARIVPESPLEAATKTNPGLALSADYANNCSYVVNAVELRARGFDVVASPVSVAMGRSAPAIARDWRTITGEIREFTRLADYDAKRPAQALKAATADWPEGARGFVAGVYARVNSAHIMNVEKLPGGTLRIIEGQVAADDAAAAAKTFRSFSPSTIQVLRVDDLIPAQSLERSVQLADEVADALTVAREVQRLRSDLTTARQAVADFSALAKPARQALDEADDVRQRLFDQLQAAKAAGDDTRALAGAFRAASDEVGRLRERWASLSGSATQASVAAERYEKRLRALGEKV